MMLAGCELYRLLNLRSVIHIARVYLIANLSEFRREL
jgi:hypothetical protein